MPVNNDYSHRSGESATYTQGLTDQLSLKIVGAYMEGRSQQFIDFEKLDENLFQVPGAFHDQQSSGEAQLAFSNDRVKAVDGVFYMDSTACGTYNASLGVLAAPPPFGFGLYLTSIDRGRWRPHSQSPAHVCPLAARHGSARSGGGLCSCELPMLTSLPPRSPLEIGPAHAAPPSGRRAGAASRQVRPAFPGFVVEPRRFAGVSPVHPKGNSKVAYNAGLG
jgi:hypothetical protein